MTLLPTIAYSADFLKMLQLKDDEAYALKPVFAARCDRLSSTNLLLPRAVIVSQEGSVLILNSGTVTHRLEVGLKRTQNVTVSADRAPADGTGLHGVKLELSKPGSDTITLVLQFHAKLAPVGVAFCGVLANVAKLAASGAGEFKLSASPKPVVEETKLTRSATSIALNQLKSVVSAVVPSQTPAVKQLAFQEKMKMQKKGEAVVVPPPATEIPKVRSMTNEPAAADATLRRKKSKKGSKPYKLPKNAKKQVIGGDEPPSADAGVAAGGEGEAGDRLLPDASDAPPLSGEGTLLPLADGQVGQGVARSLVVASHENEQETAIRAAGEDGGGQNAENSGSSGTIENAEPNQQVGTDAAQQQAPQPLEEEVAGLAATGGTSLKDMLRRIQSEAQQPPPARRSSTRALLDSIVAQRPQASEGGRNNSFTNNESCYFDPSSLPHDDDDGLVDDYDPHPQYNQHQQQQQQQQQQPFLVSDDNVPFYKRQYAPTFDQLPPMPSEEKLSRREMDRMMQEVLDEIEVLRAENADLLRGRRMHHSSIQTTRTSQLSDTHARMLALLLWDICDAKMRNFYMASTTPYSPSALGLIVPPSIFM